MVVVGTSRPHFVLSIHNFIYGGQLIYHTKEAFSAVYTPVSVGRREQSAMLKPGNNQPRVSMHTSREETRMKLTKLAVESQ